MIAPATLLDLFKAVTPTGEPVDVYRIAAARLFNVPEDMVTTEQRKAAKTAMYRGLYTN